MVRQVRLEYPGGLYHVTSRGNAKQNIFLDDDDRNGFLELLGKCIDRFAWIVPAYVLMSNHTHLVLQLTTETLSRGMHWLNGNYSRRFNRRHHRVGHVFQGRFDARVIEKETYYLEVLRYVVLNPVRAKMVALPEQYAWSSHVAICGDATAPDWLAVDDVLAQFATDRDSALPRYRCYVDAGIGLERTPWDDLVGQIYLGSAPWIDGVRARLMLKPRADEHPLQQRVVGSPAMSEIVGGVAATLLIDAERVRRGGVPRLIAAWIGSHEALLTNRQIAAGLRLRSQSHVSSLVRECEHRLGDDAALRGILDRTLSTMRGKNRRSQT